MRLPIFCVVTNVDRQRIVTGQKSPDLLSNTERYALASTGHRLLPKGAGDTVDANGYLWCGSKEVDSTTQVASLLIAGRLRWSSDYRHLVRITPQSKDGIYVADQLVFDETRQAIGQRIGSSRPFSTQEILKMRKARYATRTKLADYDGSFERPVVLVSRPLDFAEVMLVNQTS